MGRLVEGQWRTDWYQPDEEGRFVRPDTVFHSRVARDGSTPHEPEAGRYHLYVAWACPWAHRTLLMRSIKGLEDAISVSIVHPIMRDDGWVFDAIDGCTQDHLFGKNFLREIYLEADPYYSGRVTVPILWDKKLGTIVNNESREIIRMLDTEFEPWATRQVDLAPVELHDAIDAAITAIYEPINNGVYRAGFATTQSAYESAVGELFEALDHWENVLATQRYVCGDRLTEADVCLFPTLLRFDAVYFGHFKCNRRQIRDYPNLWNYVKDIYQQPGVATTFNLDQTKRHYYGSHDTINPTLIVPVGPDIAFDGPHDRDRFL